MSRSENRSRYNPDMIEIPDVEAGYTATEKKKSSKNTDKVGCFDVVRQSFLSCTSRRGFLCCCGVTLIVLILLFGLIALIIYLACWKGIPTFNIVGIVPSNSAGEGLNMASSTVSTEAILNVQVKNPNKIPLTFSSIQVHIFNKYKSDLEIGNVTITDLYLPSDSESIKQFALTIKYRLRDDPGNVILRDLVNSCTVLPGQKKPTKSLEILLKANPIVQVTREIKITIPEIQNVQSVDCPWTGTDIFRGLNMNNFDKVIQPK